MRVTLQAAFILHSRPLNETSMILDVLTQPHGRISLLAKGVRLARSRFRGLLRPFVPLLISWSGKTELMSLSAAEPAGAPLDLVGSALLSGIYLNELLVRVLPRFDACPKIFDVYQNTLISIQSDQLRERSLRLFEKTLLTELGYGFSLDKETGNNRAIVPEKFYVFIPGRGVNECAPDDMADAIFSGKCLLALHHGTLQNPEELRAARRINRLAIAALLGNRPLRSREFFQVPVKA